MNEAMESDILIEEFAMLPTYTTVGSIVAFPGIIIIKNKLELKHSIII